MNDEDTLSFECKLDEPPAKVWRALTEPALLAAWLMPNDFAAEQGHRCTFREHGTEIECEVLEVERERSLRLRWRERDLDSVVTFTLLPAIGGGTYLRLDHGGHQRLVGAFTFFASAQRLRCAA
ncbi:MAG TPA: SRPBCC domain-containing protein [Polyangiales bacterium]|nr:SRPBCC domain-containing protein [Polyangiales bacterium]